LGFPVRRLQGRIGQAGADEAIQARRQNTQHGPHKMRRAPWRVESIFLRGGAQAAAGAACAFFSRRRSADLSPSRMTGARPRWIVCPSKRASPSREAACSSRKRRGSGVVEALDALPPRCPSGADNTVTDVVNTYRVWLRYELFHGRLTDVGFQAREASLVDFIKARGNSKSDAQEGQDYEELARGAEKRIRERLTTHPARPRS
jgi:Predicted 3'-5' exonuclease related to the exonuclease domain of PolB